MPNPKTPPRKFKFTKASISSLPTPKQETYYRDTEQPKLIVKCYPSGAKAYAVNYTEHTRRRQRKLGAVTEITPTDARKLAEHFLADLIHDEAGVSRSRKIHTQRETLSQLGERYIAYKSHKLKASSIRDYRRTVTELGALCDMDAVAITGAQLERWYVDKISSSPTGSAAVANRVIRVVKALYNFGGKQQDSPYRVNPAESIRSSGIQIKTRKRKRYIVNQELPGFVSFANALVPERRNFVMWCLYSGNRSIEVRSIRQQDVSLKGSHYLLRDIKDRTDVRMPLSTQLGGIAKLQMELRPDCEQLFPRPDGQFMRSQTDFLHQCSYSFHDLRRTFRTIANKLPISRVDAARLVNHRSLEDVDADYIGHDLDQLREAAQLVADKIDELADPAFCELG